MMMLLSALDTDDSERGKVGHSSEHRAGENRRPGEAAEFTPGA